MVPMPTPGALSHQLTACMITGSPHCTSASGSLPPFKPVSRTPPDAQQTELRQRCVRPDIPSPNTSAEQLKGGIRQRVKDLYAWMAPSGSSPTAAWYGRGQTRSADHAASIRKSQGGITWDGDMYVSSGPLASPHIDSDGNVGELNRFELVISRLGFMYSLCDGYISFPCTRTFRPSHVSYFPDDS